MSFNISVGPADDLKDIAISIPDYSNRTGVMLSGGADSAILFYILVKHFPNKTIVPITVPRPDGADRYSPAIVDYVNRVCGTSIAQPLILGNGGGYHADQTVNGLKVAFKNNLIDHVFFGSQQPPTKDMVELPGIYPIRKETTDVRVSSPFFDLFKTHTIDLYFKLNQEELLSITHSCTEQTVGRCRQCFNCKEREWALSVLGRVDTGNL